MSEQDAYLLAYKICQPIMDCCPAHRLQQIIDRLARALKELGR